MARKVKKSRQRYSAEFKTEALALAAQVSVNEAASQLNVHASQRYAWRSKAQAHARQGQADSALAAENARLKRLLVEKEQELSIHLMARVLGVSRSGFYDWLKLDKPASMTVGRDTLDRQVKEIFDAHKGRYGAPRITRELHEQG